MGLERYRAKRNFRITPEPSGDAAIGGEGRSFVVQKHAATRLHYDFRLELDGVLLSWAVPKGPSLDPNEKRLAMQTEDHPLAYGDFEGVIPPKQYGAGAVMVWDRGRWSPKGDAAKAYAKGHLKFELSGEKLKGTWNLVRSRSGRYGGQNSWLLFKEADDDARLGPDAEITERMPHSVTTGRTLEEIAAQKDRVWNSNRSADDNAAAGAVAPRKRKPPSTRGIAGAVRAVQPERIEPQLATASKHPPTGERWVHEIKHDGYRMLARIADDKARMQSRSGKDWSAAFPSLVRALPSLPVKSAWIDGEAVAVDAQGRSSFQALQNAFGIAAPAGLRYLAFDLLYLDGVDLRGAALADRKRLLKQLFDDAPPALAYSEHFAAPGAAFLENVRALGCEGMISKRADLPYTAGRGSAWQKVKCARRIELVVGGYTEGEGSRQGFGALLLGVYERDGRFSYCGKVGTGFDDATLASIAKRLAPRVRKETPFHDPPTGAEGRRARWVEPALVAEVSYGEWTAEGTLRHPVFVGLREDKPAREVVREGEDAPADDVGEPAASAGASLVAGIAISNPDKLLYPEAKLSKRDLAAYYAAVGEPMLPHLRGRPLTLVRHPNGWDRKGFYQKNADDGVHGAVSRVDVGGGSTYMTVDSVGAIVALLQLGALEIHPWGSRDGSLGYPDRIVLDLDPDESLPWERVREAALLAKALLDHLGLAAFLKTTGGKGLHVVVPVEPTRPWEEVKGFTKAVAELLERTFPDRFTSKLLKVSRGGRTFIDYLRNAEGATAVGAYSLRAKAHAPVSTPVAWDELDDDLRFAHFNARTVPARIAKLAADPWKGIDDHAKPLTDALMARVGYAVQPP